MTGATSCKLISGGLSRVLIRPLNHHWHQAASPYPHFSAAGMGAGLPKYVTINLGQLSKVSEGEEVTLKSLEQKRIFSLSGREDRLPLKVRACMPVT